MAVSAVGEEEEREEEVEVEVELVLRWLGVALWLCEVDSEAAVMGGR